MKFKPDARRLWMVLLAFMMSLCLLTCSLTATAKTLSPAEQANLTNKHSIGLEGVSNARDLGGYVTRDGRTVQWGKLLRSANLSEATDTDLARLSKTYHVCKVIDFRSDFEQLTKQDREVPGAKAVNLPVLGNMFSGENSSLTSGSVSIGLDDLIAMAENGWVDTQLKNTNKNLVTSDAARSAYSQFFREVLETKGGTVLWHCSQGKDRAGFASALMLSALGVDRDVIYADYLLTNDYTAEKQQEIYDLVYGLTRDKTIAKRASLYEGVKKAWLKTAFDLIDEQYGSTEAFLNKALGLSASDLQTLQNYYLS